MKRDRKLRARAPLAVAAMALLLMSLGIPAAVADDGFTCRASALRVKVGDLVDEEPVVANKNEDPCKTESAGAINHEQEGLAAARVLFALTDADPAEDDVRAEASSGAVDLSLLDGLVQAEILTSNARVVDTGTDCELESELTGAGVVVDGTPVSVDVPDGTTINVGPVTVVINDEELQDTDSDGEFDRIIRQALRITFDDPTDLVGVIEIVVAESIADFKGDPEPCEDDDDDDGEERQAGWMTGGGQVVKTASHGFHLLCDDGDATNGNELASPSNSLQVNWKTGGKSNSFHLVQLTEALCTDDETIEPDPPDADFDTYDGQGVGRCNGDAATASWTFTDTGEPGKSDSARIEIDGTGTCNLDIEGPLLPGGNHQAHT